MRLSVIFSISLSFFVLKSYAQDASIELSREEYMTQMSNFLEKKEQELITELDSIKNKIDPKLEITEGDVAVLRRLKNIEKSIPLQYTSQVKSYIEKYTSQNYRPYMSRLLGLSKHYFGIYNQIFKELNLPEEVKFLSLVESSLNPHLVSTSGAVGPWQFMYATAKGYDLNMNSHIDERKDAYAATYAVGQYLKDAYDQFNDWQLALASYNCGRGCVQRAIQRSGMNSPSFWELAPFLPQETRNYIPKFIAMTYVLSNADNYGIYASNTELDNPYKLIMVDRNIDLAHVAEASGVSITDLKAYNPFLKKNQLYASIEKPQRLLLPITESLNDSLLYTVLNTDSFVPTKVIDIEDDSKRSLLAKNYKVRKGETLSSVSRKFGVSVQDLKAWNNLSSKSPVVGRTLILEQPVNSKLAETVKKSTKTKESSTKIVYYTVKKGDSLDRIAGKYQGVSVSKLKADNNLKGSMIKPGMKLKIKRD